MRLLGTLTALMLIAPSWGGEQPCWDVADVRPGMVGSGSTVVRGVKPEQFEVTILGVLRDVEPGRDMVIARFAGLGLEKSGVASGMSGSPVYLDGKLLGAVAYTWEFGLEPIGGITPFSQMRKFADRELPPDELADGSQRTSTLSRPSNWTDAPERMLPIRTPVSISGMSPVAFEELSRRLRPLAMVPVQGGGANPDVQAAAAPARIQPGSAVAVGLVTGDVSATAIGTVTAVENDRVYAFGHPFLELGRCELPMLSAYIHTVLPLQSSSFKMGSSLATVGVIDSDVSTGIAGRLGGRAAMVPVTIEVEIGDTGVTRSYRCEIAPVPHLIGTLLSTSVVSCIDGDGKAPPELTTMLDAEIRVRGRKPLRFIDQYAGERYQGPPGLLQSLAPLSNVATTIVSNQFEPVAIESIICRTKILARRESATITNVWTENSKLLAGERLVVRVELQPYRPKESEDSRNNRFLTSIEIPLPRDFPTGKYTASVSDARSDSEKELRRRARPVTFEQMRAGLEEQLAARQTELCVRVDTTRQDIAVDGVEWPSLPPAMAAVLSSNGSNVVSRWPSSLVSRKPTNWAIEGTKSITFEVIERRQQVGATP